jgi:hypothetical protein
MLQSFVHGCIAAAAVWGLTEVVVAMVVLWYGSLLLDGATASFVAANHAHVFHSSIAAATGGAEVGLNLFSGVYSQRVRL